MILSGIRVFIKSSFGFAEPVKTDESEEIPVEKLLASSDLTMIEINTSAEESKKLLKSQRFHGFLETTLYLVLLSFFSLAVSTVLHLLQPNREYSSWPVVLLVSLFLFALQTQLLILFRNGSKEQPEVEIAMIYGMFCFVVLIFSQYGGYRVLTARTLEQLTIHLKSLLFQISEGIPSKLPPFFLLQEIVLILFNAFLTILTMSWVLPALRFTLTLVKMTLGRPFEKESSVVTRALLCLDFLFPLVLAILFSPGINKRAQITFLTEEAGSSSCEESISSSSSSSSSSTTQTCPSNSLSSSASASLAVSFSFNPLLSLQLCSLFFFVLLKVAVFRKHVQSFMDFSVETSAVCLMIGEKQPEMKRSLVHTVMVSNLSSRVESSIVLFINSLFFYQFFLRFALNIFRLFLWNICCFLCKFFVWRFSSGETILSELVRSFFTLS
jgi:hypothetical protein